MVPSTLAVRWVHLVALGVMLGGAALLAVTDRTPPELLARYELGFWLALGAVVVTGVGNAGAMAPAVPGPETRWGQLFGLKLVGVLLLVAFSLVRTGVVRDRTPEAGSVRGWYAVTAGWVALLAALAVVMARG
ncbi:CopD family protein [Halorubrum gandharaense]